ncbi:AzlD family protein [Haloarcula japonica]|uniref:Branched-chain amino acid transport n=1 Tax=Haloarcula japonica (strain ATCC 49778 / DSM 6131 / JCM 7785 / NBRC 101032 / NCIMB 13157 / TR-1) TaxID=1227453 RepID=M0L5B7_HALJT|nr:AzlD domain-containing protein [Haloarcula japonica]EMA27180.1 branched-chain amino acid transport [Haloarcula japonica DSM 6131]
MTDPLAINPTVVAVIAAMAIATYLTKAGGLWLLTRIGVSDRVEAALEVLPGAIVVAVLGPELASGGLPEWLAGSVVAVVAWRTGNIFVALVTGVGAVIAFRAIL